MGKGLSGLDLKQQYPRDIATLNLFKVVSRTTSYGNINTPALHRFPLFYENRSDFS